MEGLLAVEAKPGLRNSNYRHGGFTCEAVEKRKRIRMVLQNARESLSAL